jgi:hypothetical protein
MGGPGVQRSTKFVTHLNKFDYEPIVLTIKEEDINKMAVNVDDTLLNAIPQNTQIVRTKSRQLFTLTKILNKLKIYRIFWYLFFPVFWERSALWPFFTYFRAKQIIKKEKIKLVYTSSAPFSSMLLGFFLQKKGKIKWVADLRDPYTDAYAWSYPSKLHWLFARVVERYILKKPDILIVNTPEVKKLYLSKHKLDSKKVVVITNGF